MSIHFYLNFDATLVSLERRTVIKGTKKTNVDRIANLSVDKPISHDELSLEEAQKVQSFVDEQMSLIEKAYLNNSARGLFGGVPAISRSTKYNRQFESLPGYIYDTPKGKFLGCISGAHAASSVNHKTANKELIESHLEAHTLPLLAKEIINVEIQSILNRAMDNSELRGNDCIDFNHAEQLVECSELITKFLKHCKIDVNHWLGMGVSHSVDEFIDDLRTRSDTAALGTSKRVRDSGLRKIQLEQCQSEKAAEESYQKRLKAEEQYRSSKQEEIEENGGLATHLLTLRSSTLADIN